MQSPTKSQRAVAAYAVAKLVYEHKMTAAQGVTRLHQAHGINRSSARIVIAVFRHLVRGERFQRGLSAPTMQYYLQRIQADFGLGVALTALSSLWQHIGYYEGTRPVTLRSLRVVAVQYGQTLGNAVPPASLEAVFQEKVRRAQADSASARQKRLAAASRKPTKRVESVFVFDRNADVVAEVLHQAKGICGRCKSPAPFKRNGDQSPYLEVHHKVLLANGGDDTVENAIALCPNCHRELHYGSSET